MNLMKVFRFIKMVPVLLLLLNIFPGLGDLVKCKNELARIATENTAELATMLYYSGRDINDLGQFHECNDLKDAKYVLLMVYVTRITVSLGICGPQSCEPSDYETSLSSFVQAYPQVGNFVDYKSIKVVDPVEYNNRSFDGGTIATLIFLSLLALIVAIGTYIEKSSKASPDVRLKGWKNFVVCFSLMTNVQKLITLPDHYDHLQLFNGVRVIGMLCISLSHTYVYYFISPLQNPLKIHEIMRSGVHHILFASLYVVDVFFVMAGFLLAYLTIAELNKRKGKMSWPMFIIHRLIRICPIYYFCLMIFINIVPHLGTGPAWPVMGQAYNRICEENWLENVLFINNFYPSGESLCMGWSWFVVNDMQLYVFSPIVLILHYKNKIFGYTAVLLLILTNVIITGVATAEYDYNPGMVYGLADPDQFSRAYIRPYFRMGAYLMGILFGFIYRGYVDAQAKMQKAKDIELSSINSDSLLNTSSKRPSRIEFLEVYLTAWVKNKVLRLVGYALGITCMVSMLMIPLNFETNGPGSWTTGEKVVYMSAEHLVFSIGLVLFMMPMVEGFGGYMLKFLTWKYFAVIAKISFSYYLVHPMIIHFYVFNRHQALYLHDLEMIYPWFATVFFTTIIATIFTLIVESPIMSLEKKLFRR